MSFQNSKSYDQKDTKDTNKENTENKPNSEETLNTKENDTIQSQNQVKPIYNARTEDKLPIADINAQNAVLKRVEFSKSIYAAPNVAPSQLKMYAGYAELDKFMTPSISIDPINSVDVVNNTQHFLKVYIVPQVSDFNAGQNLAITDPVPGIILENSPAYKDGVKVGYLGIDCNREGCPIVVNPFDSAFIEYPKLSASSDVNQIFEQGVKRTFTSENTVAELLNIITYIFSIAGKIGNYLHVDHDGRPTLPVNDLTTKLGLSEGFNYSVSFKECKGAYMFRSGINYTGLNFANMTGAIMVDDYVRYPRLEFCPILLPQAWMRLMALSKIKNPVLGVLPGEPETFEDKKAVEYCASGTDIVMATARQNAMEYLNTIIVLPDSIADLIDSTLLRPQDVDNPLRLHQEMFKFYKASINGSHFKNYYGTLTTFPMSNQYKYSFQIVERLSVTTRLRTFTQIRSRLYEMFQPFSFKSPTTILNELSDPFSTSILAGKANAASTLLSTTSELDSGILATKAAMDMYSIYTNFNAFSYVIGNGVTKIGFTSELFGLVIARMMYPNVYRINRLVWIAMCDSFLRIYFRETYNLFFRTHGYGTTTNGTPIHTLYGHNRTTLDVDVFSFEAGIATKNELFNRVLRLLNLNETYDGLYCEVKIDDCEYRINGRTIRIPGNLRYAKIDPSSDNLPATNYLSDVQSICSDYYKQQAENLSVSKPQATAEKAIIDMLPGYIESFSQFFHYVYCPIYLAVAKSPMLLHSDVKGKYAHSTMYGFFDAYAPVAGSKLQPKVVSPQASTLPFDHLDFFSGESVREGIFLLLSATAPGCRTIHGRDIDIPVLDWNVYGKIYSADWVNEQMATYINELYVRHVTMESLSITSGLISNQLFAEDVPDLMAYFQNLQNFSSFSAASWAYLLKLFGYDNGKDINMDKMRATFGGSLLYDSRIIEPVGAVFSYAKRDKEMDIMFVNPIRSHVRKNASLLMRYILGRRAIRKIRRGVSISYEERTDYIEFNATHDEPPMNIVFSQDYTTDMDSDYNVLTRYYASVEVPGARGFKKNFVFANANDLLRQLKNDREHAWPSTLTLPCFRVLVTTPDSIPVTCKNLLYTFLSNRLVRIDMTYPLFYTTHHLCHMYSIPGSESSFSLSEFIELLSSKSFILHNINVFSNAYELGAVSNFAIVKTILPLERDSGLLVVMDKLYSVGRRPDADIKMSYIPTPSRMDPDYTQFSISKGRERKTVDNYYYALSCVDPVYKLPPITYCSLICIPVHS